METEKEVVIKVAKEKAKGTGTAVGMGMIVDLQGTKLQHRQDRKRQQGESVFQADVPIAERQRRPCGDRKYTRMVHRQKSVMVSRVPSLAHAHHVSCSMDGRYASCAKVES